MNQNIEKKLREYIGQDKLISVYSDSSEPDCFDLGFVLAVDDDFVLLNDVNRFGEETGFILCNSDDVFMVCYDVPYAEKLKKLFVLKNQQRRKINIVNGDLLVSLLAYANKNDRLVKVNDDDDCIGYVKDYQNQTLELQMIGNYGEDLGVSYLDFDNINILETDTEFLKDLMLLYGQKH